MYCAIHNALNKLRVHLDAFSAALEVMGVKELITLFPNVMKPLFVYGVTRAHDVVRMLRPHHFKNLKVINFEISINLNINHYH